MAATDRNLSLDSRSNILIGVAEINLGMGNLTLSATFVDYTHADGLTIRVRDFSHEGSFQTFLTERISTPLMVFADGNIALNSVINVNRLELRADADGDGMGMITSMRRSLGVSSVFLQQAGEFPADLFDTMLVTGAVTFRITGMGVDQVIHPWMAGLGRTDFSLRGLEGRGLARGCGAELHHITGLRSRARVRLICKRPPSI